MTFKYNLPQQIVNVISKYFLNIYRASNICSTYDETNAQLSNCDIHFGPINETDVLQTLKNSKSDNIPSFMVKDSAHRSNLGP